MPWLAMDGHTYSERCTATFATIDEARAACVARGAVLRAERLQGSFYSLPDHSTLRIESWRGCLVLAFLRRFAFPNTRNCLNPPKPEDL